MNFFRIKKKIVNERATDRNEKVYA